MRMLGFEQAPLTDEPLRRFNMRVDQIAVLLRLFDP